LVLRPAHARGYLDVLGGLEIDRHAGHAGDGALEAGDDLVNMRAPLVRAV
jgi:hypothetical protein